MKKILVLDDDEAIREVFEIILAKAGFAVSILADGDGLLHDRFDEPDLFIIDKQLPGVDGLDICRFLKRRERYATTPIIVISASNRVEEIAIDAGADEFIEKPFRSKMLIDIVKKYLS